jgi:DNA-binding transcriptional MocR family regulator
MNDNTGLCYPSHKTLAQHTGYERTTVSRALKNLRSRGLISWSKKRRAGQFAFNNYTINRVALNHAANIQEANNDNTVLHEGSSPCGNTQHKPLVTLNEPFTERHEIDSSSDTHLEQHKRRQRSGPPKSPEDFEALSPQMQDWYARNRPSLMADLRRLGLNFDRDEAIKKQC